LETGKGIARIDLTTSSKTQEVNPMDNAAKTGLVFSKVFIATLKPSLGTLITFDE